MTKQLSLSAHNWLGVIRLINHCLPKPDRTVIAFEFIPSTYVISLHPHLTYISLSTRAEQYGKTFRPILRLGIGLHFPLSDFLSYSLSVLLLLLKNKYHSYWSVSDVCNSIVTNGHFHTVLRASNLAKLFALSTLIRICYVEHRATHVKLFPTLWSVRLCNIKKIAKCIVRGTD